MDELIAAESAERVGDQASAQLAADFIFSRVVLLPHRQKGLEPFPSPIDAMVDDQTILDVHRLDQINLFSSRRLAWILPGEKVAGRKVKITAIKLTELSR